jgi:regulator of protease activity HflC (stomatin/prohibitin superfamily)
MFGIQFIKANPTNYLIQYTGGKVKKEGTGLSFFYFSPSTSIVSIPVATIDVPFILKETTGDFQQLTIQGQIVYRITTPSLIAEKMNFTLDKKGTNYVSQDPEKLQNRIINHVQVQIRNEIQKLNLKAALTVSDILVNKVLEQLKKLESIKTLGIEILDLQILAIKPVPETARALEAEIREQLLKEADNAIYDRRNAAVEHERAIKENELNTEIAIEHKNKEIRETRMDADLAVQQKEHQMAMAEINSKIEHEEESKKYIMLTVENKRVLADSKTYELTALLKPLLNLDANTLEILAQSQMDADRLIARAFKELSENANKIGQLNISPDLLTSLLEKKE